MPALIEYDYIGDATAGGIRSVARAVPVPDAVLEQMVRFFFGSNRWHESVEEVHRQVRKWKQAIRAGSPAPTIVRPPEPVPAVATPVAYPWLAEAVKLRREGVSWRKLADTMDVAEPTVRRHVSRVLAEAAA